MNYYFFKKLDFLTSSFYNPLSHNIFSLYTSLTAAFGPALNKKKEKSIKTKCCAYTAFFEFDIEEIKSFLVTTLPRKS
jgi:hypothetical protein